MASTANFFNHTEDAFLLSSLQEVVRVWARGTGHADFGLNVNDGVAELKLSFTLGHPYDLHCTPPQFVSPNPDQDSGVPRKDIEKVQRCAQANQLHWAGMSFPG